MGVGKESFPPWSALLSPLMLKTGASDLRSSGKETGNAGTPRSDADVPSCAPPFVVDMIPSVATGMSTLFLSVFSYVASGLLESRDASGFSFWGVARRPSRSLESSPRVLGGDRDLDRDRLSE